MGLALNPPKRPPTVLIKCQETARWSIAASENSPGADRNPILQHDPQQQQQTKTVQRSDDPPEP